MTDDQEQKQAPDYSLATDIDDSNLFLVRIDNGRFAGTIYSYGDMTGLEADGTPKFKVRIKQLVVNGVGTLNMTMTDNVLFQQEVLTPILIELMDLVRKSQEVSKEESKIIISE